MNNETILKNIKMIGNDLVAIQDGDGIWVSIRWTCDGFGFNSQQMKYEKVRVQRDPLLSKGIKKLKLPTNGGNQSVLCLRLDYVPIWLAKITITKNIREDNPEFADKLEAFQMKTKYVLTEKFISVDARTKKPLFQDVALCCG